jgi:nucleoside-diphosphate-sugar epimerase
VLFISTASVVTAPSGKCVDEREPYAGYANTYTRSKREAELIVESSGLDMVIVRPSIVLSRGVRDAAMARSILWAVPMMGALGEIPVDARARVDLVPVDFTARAIARLATAPSLRHRRYHVSSGGTACTFEELLEAVRPASPVTRRIRPAGSRFRPVSRKRAPLLRALELYFPFINADVRYSNERLLSELGGRGLPPAAVTYLPELVRRIGMWEARTEMALP